MAKLPAERPPRRQEKLAPPADPCPLDSQYGWLAEHIAAEFDEYTLLLKLHRLPFRGQWFFQCCREKRLGPSLQQGGIGA